MTNPRDSRNPRPTRHLPRSRFAIPLATLEGEAHTPEADQVEEIAAPPNPDLVPEERRRLESFLKWGTQG